MFLACSKPDAANALDVRIFKKKQTRALNLYLSCDHEFRN